MSKKAKSAISIPVTLKDITAAWLTEALAPNYPGVVVTSAKVSEFIGHKPNKARVTVKYNAAGNKAGLPASLFIKGSLKPAAKLVDGLEAGLDIANEIECMAYKELVPLIDVNTPKTYAVLFDKETYCGVIVMEDLLLSGATFVKPMPSLNYAQTTAFIDAMARMHAPWLNSKELKAGGTFGPKSGLAKRTALLHRGYFDHMATTPQWGDYVKEPRGAGVPRMYQDSARAAAAMNKMQVLHQACPNTIVHGDEHRGNLYLDAKGRPGFIDWCARIEPWVIGFTYFFVVVVDAMDRRQWERPMLSLYLERLARYGATPPNFEEAWYMYRCTTVYPFVAWMINAAVWQPEAVNTVNAMRGVMAMMDHDAYTLLGV